MRIRKKNEAVDSSSSSSSSRDVMLASLWTKLPDIA